MARPTGTPRQPASVASGELTDERLLRLATFASSRRERAHRPAGLDRRRVRLPALAPPANGPRSGLAGTAASLAMIQDGDRQRIEQLERRLAETQLLTFQLTGMVADLTRIAASQARHLDLHDRVLAPPVRKKEAN